MQPTTLPRQERQTHCDCARERPATPTVAPDAARVVAAYRRAWRLNHPDPFLGLFQPICRSA
jgi:hypothetical protein